MTEDTPDANVTPIKPRTGKGSGTRPASGRPATPYEEGNTAAQKHGARSPRAIAALAQQFADQAIDANPALGLAAFRWELDAWASAEAIRCLITDHLDDQALVNNRNTPRHGLLERLHAAERSAARGREALGLSPLSAAKVAMMLRAGGADILSPSERLHYLPGNQTRIQRSLPQ